MKNALAIFSIIGVASLPVRAAETPALTEDEKTFYAIGVLLSRSVQTFELTPAELARVQQGLTDGALGHAPVVDVQAYSPKVQELQRARLQIAAAKTAKAGAAFLESAAKQSGAVKTNSGIVITTLAPGQGKSPVAADKVKVHYEGKLIDGTVFDSSVRRGEPAVFPLTGVIPCWTEAVQLMKVGGKARIVCPAALAYGERGSPPLILPGSTLIFEVQLLDIVK